jgi:hypothetical protein
VPAERFEHTGDRVMAEPPVVELTVDQLYVLCLAASWSVEADHPGAELTALRSVLESVEERLLLAWADVELALTDAGDSHATAAGAGVV